MKISLPVLLCIALLVLLGALVFLWLRRRSKHKPPATAQSTPKMPDPALRALEEKLLHDYRCPGGLRSQCLQFLSLAEEDAVLSDPAAVRVQLINSYLYPLQQAVARYTAARNAINGAQPGDLPLLKALENVFFSPSLTRCLQEEALDHDLCLQLLEDVQKDVRLLTAQREWR